MSAATKACPYCGEQILQGAVKCKHCASELPAEPDTSAPVSVGGLMKSQFVMRRIFVVPALTLLALLGVGMAANWARTGTLLGNGFSDKEVTAVENDIRAHYARQRGMKVDDVRMIRESPNKLAGFAKVHLLGMAMNKSCTATLGVDGRSLWQCK